MPKILDRLVSQLTRNGMSKDKAYAVAVKKLQESAGKNASFLQKNLESAASAVPTFATGTNDIVKQASSALSNTPFKDVQFPSADEVASKLSLDKISLPSVANFKPSSTNPITI